MSGGSMEYACYKVSDIADMEEDLVIRSLLKDLSEYLHAEEWYRSADTSRESYIKARKKFKKKWLDTQVDVKPYVDQMFEDFRAQVYELIDVEGEKHERSEKETGCD